MRRRLLALAAVVAVVAGVVAVVVVSRDGDEATRPAQDAGAEALAFASRRAPAVVAVDTGAPLAGLVLQDLVPRLTDRALTVRDVQPLLGNDAVVALLDPKARRAQVSFVARDRADVDAITRGRTAIGRHRGARLYAAGGRGVVAIRNNAIVAAPDEAAVRRALDVRADPRAHLTPSAFDQRLADLSPAAPVRAVFDARAVLTAQEPGLRRTRWGRALRNGAAVLSGTRGGLRLPFRLQTAPGLTKADLPFATGERTPVARGRAPVVLGVRGFDRLLAFARRVDPTGFAGIDRLQDDLPSFLRIDVDGLIGGLRNDATITATADRRRLVVRTDPGNAGLWRTAIEGAATLSGLLRRFGVDDVVIDEEPGEVYRLRVGGRLVVRAGIYGPTLAIGNDPRANLRAAARAPVSPLPAGAAGGLTLRVQARSVRDLLGLPAEAAPLLTGLGDLTGWAGAETDGVRGELQLAAR